MPVRVALNFLPQRTPTGQGRAHCRAPLFSSSGRCPGQPPFGVRPHPMEAFQLSPPHWVLPACQSPAGPAVSLGPLALH